MTRPALLLTAALALAACGGTSDTLDAAGDTGTDAAHEISPDASPEVALPAPFDWCEGAPPDAACYAARRDPGSEHVALARAIADCYLDV